MKQKNKLVPISAQERKEDIDMLMDSEMQDSIIGGKCSKCSDKCETCRGGCSDSKKNVVIVIDPST